jgi:tail tube protein
MTQITKLNATTELEAVNAMLAALGEAPLASLDVDATPDIIVAINTLRDATREVQSMGWDFNREWGYELKPALTYSYQDRTGNVTGLNVFQAPARMIRFELSKLRPQLIPTLDVVLRPSRTLVVTVSNAGEDNQTLSQVSDLSVSGAIRPMIFYDRILNRDGLDSNRYPFLYIDPVWAFDFEQMPEEARRFSLILAMRRFLASQAPSVNLVGFTQQDQTIALRNLQAAYGEQDEDNMLDNGDVRGARGHRPVGYGSPIVDIRRKSPGPA